MAREGDVGVTLDAGDTATLFGEDQGRYLIACSFDKAEALMTAAAQTGVTLTTAGRFTGSDVKLGRTSAPLAELSDLFSTSFEAAIF